MEPMEPMTALLDLTLLAADQAPGFPPMLISLIIIFALFYFMMIRPEQRKQREHKALLEALKKNDRVVTAGGIYGVVTNVQRDSNEVTIKVDEANNTKLRVTITSIARVVTPEASEEKAG
jgi:preprotein translocase subunit YajC